MYFRLLVIKWVHSVKYLSDWFETHALARLLNSFNKGTGSNSHLFMNWLRCCSAPVWFAKSDQLLRFIHSWIARYCCMFLCAACKNSLITKICFNVHFRYTIFWSFSFSLNCWLIFTTRCIVFAERQCRKHNFIWVFWVSFELWK